MHKRVRRYSSEEFDRRGTQLYEQSVRPLVEQGNHGRIVAIDIESGDYQLADEVLEACEPLIAKNPDAQLYCIRIGHPAVDRFGFHPFHTTEGT
jgi:hypothetical protein